MITGYLFCLLLFVEVSLQAFYYFTSGSFLSKRTAVPIYRHDKYMGYSVKPNLSFHHATNEFDSYIYTNSEGIRTSRSREEYSLSKENSRYRILLLGPSFAFGWGVNHQDTFANQLKNDLEARGFAKGRKIEVINAGVPAIPPLNQLNWFDGPGQRYSPDLVVQFIYGAMSVGNEMDTDIEVNNEGYLVARNETFAQKMQRQLKKAAVVYYGWVVSITISPAVGRLSKNKQVLGAGRKLEEQTEFDAEDKETRGSLDFYQHLSVSISRAGAKLLVVHFPLSYCVHREDITRWRHLGVEDVDGQIAFNEKFCGYVDQQGIPCLNITRDLIREAQHNRDRLYYWLDIHWTPKGNRVAAESVAHYLVSQRDL
jgi:lysophospholipase L1-like esterase